jgi:hypothetical protein
MSAVAEVRIRVEGKEVRVASLSSRWHSSSPASYISPTGSQPSSDGRRIRAGKTSPQTTFSANRTLKVRWGVVG